MSGSPVYLDGKLLGAVAYAWPFGKEPIAGITPFCQMHGFVEAYERRDLAEQEQAARASACAAPLQLDGRDFDTVTVAAGLRRARSRPPPTACGWCRCARRWRPPGFTPHSLALLRDRLQRRRPGADAGRRPSPATSPSEEKNVAARARRPAGRRPDHRRLRPVRHRHRHAHRGQPRLRLGPSVLGPRRLRLPADDRLHPHHLSRGRASASRWARRCGPSASSTPTSAPASPAGSTASPTCCRCV